MKSYFIDFKNMEWESPAPGVRQKSYIGDNQRIRLAEFTDEFVEEEWCTKGHIDYLLEGSISIDFDGIIINFSPGDVLFIPEGEESKHKGKIAKGEKALIILFEKINKIDAEKECKNIEDVRKNIDEIDRRIVKLLSERRYFVKQAAKFKENSDDVKAPKRVEEVIKKVRGLAEQYDVSPDIVENIYRTLIESFINYEMSKLNKKE